MTSWLKYPTTVKLVSLADQTAMPFVADPFPLFALLSPAVLFGIAWIVWSWPLHRTLRRRCSLRAGWLLVSLLFLTAAALGPESLGQAHGGFLRERLLLLALLTVIPVWKLRPRRRPDRLLATLTLIALAVQSGFVLEYARESSARIAALMRLDAHIPPASSVLVLQPKRQPRLRAIPELHASNLFGVESPRLVWNNYEAMHYVFPVSFRRPLDDCEPAAESEAVERAIHEPSVSDAGWWRCRIRSSHERIDSIVLWDTPPGFEAIVTPWYEETAGYDSVRLYRRRECPPVIHLEPSGGRGPGDEVMTARPCHENVTSRHSLLSSGERSAG